MRCGLATRVVAIAGVLSASACGLAITGAGDLGSDAGADSSVGPAPNKPSDGGALSDSTSAPPDAATIDDAEAAAPQVIAVIQSASAANQGSNLSVTIAPTKTGSFLAVAYTVSNTNFNVLSIADNATGGSNTYVSAGLRSTSGSCQASEIWFARNVKPGATSIVLTRSGTSGSHDVWVVEASGLAPTGGLDKGMVGDDDDMTVITAPSVQPTGAPALMFASVASCGTIGSIVGGNPFTALQAQDGNNAAYLVTPSVAPFAPVFNNSNNSWNASVAAFR